MPNTSPLLINLSPHRRWLVSRRSRDMSLLSDAALDVNGLAHALSVADCYGAAITLEATRSDTTALSRLYGRCDGVQTTSYQPGGA